MIPSHMTADRATLERVSREQCQVASLAPGTVLCRVLGTYLAYVDPDDVGMTPHLCLNGFWESWITLALIRALKPGAHCVDVGANVGYYSLIMADVAGSSGRLLAVEPNPAAAALVRLNLEINGLLDGAEVVETAAFDRSQDQVAFAIPPRRGLMARLCDTPQEGETVLPVATASIDQMTAGWSRVDVVKIDAEGAEDVIWRGMAATLERNPRILVILEFTPARYADPAAFVAGIVAAGFVLRHIAHDGTVVEIPAGHLTGGTADWWMLYLTREAG